MEKYRSAGKATDDLVLQVPCVLDAKGYKYTQSGCVIFIDFPLQQWLHESARMLHYTYIICRVTM